MTIASTIGRTIGATAAYTVHAAAVSVKATGRFGADVVLGTSEGYADHSERLAAQRAAYGVKSTKIAIAVKPRKAIAA
jgi:hypothetical protein